MASGEWRVASDEWRSDEWRSDEWKPETLDLKSKT